MPRGVAVALRWLPAALYAAFIWHVSAMSNPSFVPVAQVPFQDKGVHFLVYGILALLVAGAALGTWMRWPKVAVFLLAVAAPILWGALDEFHQSFVTGRHSDVLDLAADALGALTGAALCVGSAYLFRRLRSHADRGARPPDGG